MEIIAILLIFIVVLAVSIFFNAFCLNWITRLFKVENANFKTAIRITILAALYSILAAIMLLGVLYVIKLQALSTYLLTIAGGYILHLLLKKYYYTDWKKNIKIYISYSILTIIISVVVSLSIIVPIRKYVVQPFYVAGKAMEPNFVDKEYLLFKMYDKNYQRGEVIILKNPKDTTQDFIKRIVGLPGEKIQIKGGVITIFNDENPNGYTLEEKYLASDVKTFGLDENVITLKNNEYYVLGDNRNASKDSRFFGPVNKNLFVGKFWFSPLK